jgi:AhpD family alkylhydroperoxidase
MKHLSGVERELVSIGAAIRSSCVPCVVYHIRQARNQGLTDEQIRDSIVVAEGVGEVPAELVSSSAYAQLEDTARSTDVSCGCVDSGEPDSSPCCS